MKLSTYPLPGKRQMPLVDGAAVPHEADHGGSGSARTRADALNAALIARQIKKGHRR